MDKLNVHKSIPPFESITGLFLQGRLLLIVYVWHLKLAHRPKLALS